MKNKRPAEGQHIRKHPELDVLINFIIFVQYPKMQMRILPKLKTRKGLIAVGAALVLVFLLILAASHAGTFLVRHDASVSRSDAAVILMGSIADRVLEASDVYKASVAERFIVVNNIQYGSEALEPYGVRIPNFATLSVGALKQLGIPAYDIVRLPGRATSTRDEADTVSSWLKTHSDIKTLAIISSAPHTRRAAMIFRDSFNDHHVNVRVVAIPSKYTPFVANRWWTDRESAKQVFMEYVKIFSFLTVEQWL